MYDKHRGGMGLSVAAAPLFPALLAAAHARVLECGCSNAKGCPGERRACCGGAGRVARAGLRAAVCMAAAACALREAPATPYTQGCSSTRCACTTAGCVQHLECRNYNAVLSKRGAEVVLRHVRWLAAA
jgi:ATP-dependent helicase YprA (DUF1998 family)